MIVEVTYGRLEYREGGIPWDGRGGLVALEAGLGGYGSNGSIRGGKRGFLPIHAISSVQNSQIRESDSTPTCRAGFRLLGWLYR